MGRIASGASSITVTPTGSTNTIPATVVGADTAHNLALLEVSSVSNLHVFAFAFVDPSRVAADDDVIAFG